MTSSTNRRPFRAVLAAVTGTALLAGGLSTFALWSDSANLPGGTVTSGDLELETGPASWVDASVDATSVDWDPDEHLAAPADVLRLVMPIRVVGSGANLCGELSVTGIDTSAYRGYLNYVFGLDNPRFVRKAADPAHPDFDTFLFREPVNGAETATASITFTFDGATPQRVAQRAATDLSNASFVLSQKSCGDDSGGIDTDGDGSSDAWEDINGFDRLNPDENDNGVLDGDEKRKRRPITDIDLDPKDPDGSSDPGSTPTPDPTPTADPGESGDTGGVEPARYALFNTRTFGVGEYPEPVLPAAAPGPASDTLSNDWIYSDDLAVGYYNNFETGELHRFDFATGTDTLIDSSAGWLTMMYGVVSADGRYLAFRGTGHQSGTMITYDTVLGEKFTYATGATVLGFRGSKAMAYEPSSGIVWGYDAKTLGASKVYDLTEHGYTTGQLAQLSVRSGSHATIAVQDSTGATPRLLIHEIATGAVTEVIDHNGVGTSVYTSPNGRYVAIGATMDWDTYQYTSTPGIYDVATGTWTDLSMTCGQIEKAPSSDGQLLCYSSAIFSAAHPSGEFVYATPGDGIEIVTREGRAGSPTSVYAVSGDRIALYEVVRNADSSVDYRVWNVRF